MGLLSLLLPGWEANKYTTNALLVEIMLPRLTESNEGKYHLAHAVGDVIRTNFPNRKDESIMETLDQECRIVQLNFVAIALDRKNINPPFSGEFWHSISNPFRLGYIDPKKVSRWLQSTADRLERSHGIRPPIISQPICFSDWMNTSTAKLMRIMNDDL
jgi:hypothetical protein